MAFAGMRAAPASSVNYAIDQIRDTHDHAVINVKGEIENAGGAFTSEDGRKACGALFDISLLTQETQGGKAQRIVIAMQTMQYEMFWLAGKLVVFRR